MRELTRKYKFNDLYSSVKAATSFNIYLQARTLSQRLRNIYFYAHEARLHVLVWINVLSISPAALDSYCVHSPVIFRISNGVHAIRFSS